ncbi:MAG: hypothetical protein ACE5FQ_15305, partial [Thiogranum sp.]
ADVAEAVVVAEAGTAEAGMVPPGPTAAAPEQDVVAVESDVVVTAPVTEAPAGVPGEVAEEEASAAAVEPDMVQQEPAPAAAPVFRPLTESESSGAIASAGGRQAALHAAPVDSAPEQMPADTSEQAAVENGRVVAESAAAGQNEAPASGFQKQLELARASFWRRDIRSALQIYQRLAQTYPDRAEVWGEMGNLYFNIRRTPDAMNAYARAIQLLTEQGDDARARTLLDVMYRLDARRASQFEMRLRQTGG